MAPAPLPPATPRIICKFCRRPAWQDTDAEGEPYYRHMDARFDMLDFPYFHIAGLFVPERLLVNGRR